MNPRIISWNVTGLNKRDKRLRVSNWLRDWKVDIVCLQETKLKGLSSNIICSLWGWSRGLVLLGFYWGLGGYLDHVG
jgi:hypothetical protein